MIVEDEPQIRKMLTLVLDDENYKVIECSTGKNAVRMSAATKPDIILLDLGLPDMDGQQVITALREWCQAPIIVLSVRSTDNDVIELLDHGADDYVIKPFNFDVLRARISAALRKSFTNEISVTEISNGPLRINLVRHEVYLDDKLIYFTPKEYSLIKFFIGNCGKMLGHRDILREVWGPAHSDDTQYLRSFIKQIRDKIENDPAAPAIIITEPGIGYRMELIQISPSEEQGDLLVNKVALH